MAVKLMVPGELALAACEPRFAYGPRDDCPPGLSREGRVEFEVELLEFDREGFWQQLSMAERFDLAERLKAKGNALFKAGKYDYAKAR